MIELAPYHAVGAFAFQSERVASPQAITNSGLGLCSSVNHTYVGTAVGPPEARMHTPPAGLRTLLEGRCRHDIDPCQVLPAI